MTARTAKTEEKCIVSATELKKMEKENTKNITSIGCIPDFENVLKVDFEYWLTTNL